METFKQKLRFGFESDGRDAGLEKRQTMQHESRIKVARQWTLMKRSDVRPSGRNSLASPPAWWRWRAQSRRTLANYQGVPCQCIYNKAPVQCRYLYTNDGYRETRLARRRTHIHFQLHSNLLSFFLSFVVVVVSFLFLFFFNSLHPTQEQKWQPQSSW